MAATMEKKNKILVVDDNSENIRIIGSILRENAYQVGFAMGGQQALDVLETRGKEYDLILLDVNMPGLNGFEVCRKIREKQRLKEIPVIFLTANSEPERIIEGFSSGGQDYVTKPFHAGELLSRISTHIELKNHREQLLKMNIILDMKVKERTRELEEANKKLEKANLELEKLDVAKVDFLHLISHEINTPLNGILGFASLLQEQLKFTEYFSFIEYLSESAKRLRDFAQLSLLITELRTTPENFPRKIFNFRQIIENVLTEQKTLIESKKIKISDSLEAVNTFISGNADLIKTCLIQLLKNAVHYSPAGKTISISCSEKNGRLNVSIDDEGPGFSEDALQNLFKPFSPGEKHVDKNKGLGLVLVKMIADYHHAQIRVSNKTDHGARVELVFDTENVGG
jgi:two-component system, sensor histidine kinase and response regulator